MVGGKNILLGGGTSLVLGLLMVLYNWAAPEEPEVPAVAGRPSEGRMGAMERVDIFGGERLLNGELNPLVLSRRGRSRLTKAEVESALSKPIRNRLKDIFLREGRSFESMSGRIYYELGDFSIEVLVMWKDGPESEDFTFYDRFEISLTR